MEEQQESRLKTFLYSMLYSVARQWRQVVAMMVIGMMFGLIVAGANFIRNHGMNYEVTCSVAVMPTDAEGKHLSGSDYLSRDDYEIGEQMTEAAIYCMKSDDMAAAALKEAGMDSENAQTVQDNMSFTQFDTTQIIEITLHWSGEQSGVVLMNAYVKAVEKELPKQLSVGQVTVVQSPKTAYVSRRFQAVKWFGLLTFAGLFLGTLSALMSAFLRPTLLSTADMENVFGLDSLGVIPKDRTLPDHMKADTRENVELAAYVLRNHTGSKKQKILFLTSSIRGEGRTWLTAEIGKALAGMQKKVLLLDLDMRNPSLGRFFMNEVTYDHSLNALYKGDITKEDAVVQVSPYLSVLPAILQHTLIPFDDTLFEMLKEVTDGYNFILIDAPPVGTTSSVLALNHFADGCIFVAGYDEASLATIQKALDRLEKSGTELIGCIVNKAQTIRMVMEKPVRKHTRIKPVKTPDRSNQETDETIRKMTLTRPADRKEAPKEKPDVWSGYQADEEETDAANQMDDLFHE